MYVQANVVSLNVRFYLTLFPMHLIFAIYNYVKAMLGEIDHKIWIGTG
jgi:hypothetical protein